MSGGVISYPTESVYGLGCDPQNYSAFEQLLQLKERPLAKGVILIAASVDQLDPYIDPEFELLDSMLKSWPGPHTWIVPTHPQTPLWIHGEHDSIAVRVTAHPIASSLCRAFNGALVSTSANRAGSPPIRSLARLRHQFANRVDYHLPGELGTLHSPTTITDARSGRNIRG